MVFVAKNGCASCFAFSRRGDSACLLALCRSHLHSMGVAQNQTGGTSFLSCSHVDSLKTIGSHDNVKAFVSLVSARTQRAATELRTAMHA